jgi:ADP-heptose:LPS heptosyltransferase
MKKKVFILREAAFGDHIHMSAVIRAFYEEGWEVSMCYNFKGAQVQSSNPMITHHHYFESSAKDATMEHRKKHIEFLKRARDEHDRFVSLQQTLEEALIPGEHRSEYFWPLWLRRAKNSDINFYDQSMICSGLTDKKFMGRTGDIFFERHEHEFVVDWLQQFKDKYIILWAIRGSMYQKAMYPLAKPVLDEFIKRHPETVVITTGDKFCQQWEWDHPQVIHKSGRIPFRQALNIAKYVDMVVTPETGLGIGAGAFGVPKIMLLTAASITNIVGNDPNDYSLQSPAYCSPCFRAIYNTRNCPMGPARYINGKIIDHMPIDEYGKEEVTRLPLCIEFDPEVILEQMEKIYKSGYERNWTISKEDVS